MVKLKSRWKFHMKNSYIDRMIREFQFSQPRKMWKNIYIKLVVWADYRCFLFFTKLATDDALKICYRSGEKRLWRFFIRAQGERWRGVTFVFALTNQVKWEA